MGDKGLVVNHRAQLRSRVDGVINNDQQQYCDPDRDICLNVCKVGVQTCCGNVCKCICHDDCNSECG